MTPDRNGAGRRQRKRAGAHRKRRTHSALRRTIVVGGAVACIGIAFEAATPTADALSIVFNTRNADGSGSTIRINIFDGNIFDPQLGMLGTLSDNSTSSDGGVVTRDNSILSMLTAFWDRDIVIGDAVASSNTTEISFGSYNIFNPQFSLAGLNVSNNKTVGNVATGKGNNASTKTTSTSTGFLPSLLGGMTGNGNTVQLAFFSGNIFNPQWSILGANVSNNTAVTNVAAGNGNNSSAAATPGWLRVLGAMRGNGNTTQVAGVTSNIYNQQTAFGGGNVSFNTAVTNVSTRNGNGSSATTTSGGFAPTIFGSTGNGNTNQAAASSSNISNNQVNIGINTVGTVYTNRATTGDPWESGSSTFTVRTDNPGNTNSAVVGSQQQSSSAVSQATSNNTVIGNRQQSSASGAPGAAGSNSTALNNQTQSSGSSSTGSGSSAGSNESTSSAGGLGHPGAGTGN